MVCAFPLCFFFAFIFSVLNMPFCHAIGTPPVLAEPIVLNELTKLVRAPKDDSETLLFSCRPNPSCFSSSVHLIHEYFPSTADKLLCVAFLLTVNSCIKVSAVNVPWSSNR